MRPAVRLAQRKRVELFATPKSVRSFGQRSAHTASTRYLNATHPEDNVPTAVTDQISHLSKDVLNTYARPPLIMSHGRGLWVYSTTNQKYLDFSAGIAVNALGHADPELAKVMAEQASKLMHASNLYHNEWAGQLATLLVDLTKRDGGLGWNAGAKGTAEGDNARVFFSNSGTEANEAAFKFARKVGKERWARQGTESSPRKWEDAPKTRFLCFENAFHGRSMGALSATTNPKYQKPFAPLIPGFDVGKLNDIEGMRKLLTEDTCGVIVEPVQGEGGIDSASEEFLRALRARCDEVGAVLIYDEIQCGLYRSGNLWAHSSLPTDCHPDMVTMAKPLANGFPIGAVMVREHVADAVTIGSHGTTFGGSVIATRLGHHVLSRLSEPKFISHLQDTAAHLKERLSLLPEAFPGLLQPTIRGRGLILGIPFKNTEDPGKLMKLARERGLLVLTAGKDAVRLVPSLTVTKEEADLAMDIIESCLTLMSK